MKKMQNPLSLRKLTAGLCFSVFLNLLPVAVQAEYLGLISGREATPAKTTDLSVELGLVTGELRGLDYQNIAARVNYRLSPELLFTAAAGVSEFGETDGVPLGLGLTYHLSNQRISQKVEIAGKASYHFGDYSLADEDGELTSLSMEVLVSGVEPLMVNGLSWYSNVGYHRLSVDFGNSKSSNEFGVGAGLVLPTGLGEAYLGFEHIDDLSIGLGIRYFVN